MQIKMTIDECLEFADEWIKGVTLHEGSQGWRVVCMLLAEEVRRMRQQIADAPPAIMDTCDVLGICAPTEDDFPALYAIQGRRVRLVLDDETPNAALRGGSGFIAGVPLESTVRTQEGE